jgi:hypothetical protein
MNLYDNRPITATAVTELIMNTNSRCTRGYESVKFISTRIITRIIIIANCVSNIALYMILSIDLSKGTFLV